jgi:uncharacterized caspase-like protein
MIYRETPYMRAVTLWSRAAVLAVIVLVIQQSLSMAAKAQTEGRDLRVQRFKAVVKLPSTTKRFALIIGIDEYEDAQINKLDGASNDAKALAGALIQHAGFIRDQVFVLASDQPQERRPTRARILRQLANLQGLIPKDGLLLVAFAGHGMERGGQAYLLPSDAQLSGNISLLEQTAINVEEIKKWIRQIEVEQVVIFLDACRNNPISARGIEDNVLTEAYTRGFSFDVRNAEVKAFATLYAAEVGHRAYEYKEKRQGYFTYALVQGLEGKAANEKGEVTLASLRKYLEEEVPKRVQLDLGKQQVQRPFAITEGYKADELVIAISPAIPSAAATNPARSISNLAENERKRGEQLLKEGKVEDAEKAFTMADRLDPEGGEMWHAKRALQLYEAGRPKEATAQEEKARQLRKLIAEGIELSYQRARVEVLIKVGNTLSQNEDWENAALVYAELVKLEPNNANWLFNLGLISSKLKQFQVAEAAFSKAVSLEPENSRFYDALGSVLLQEKKWSDAERAFSNAVRLEPKNPLYQEHLREVRKK